MKPNFTQEQKDWICYQIGEWYIEWKNKLIDYDSRTNKLGHAKEILKLMVCDDMELAAQIFKDLMKGLNDNVE